MIKISNIQIKVSKKFSNDELLTLALKKIVKKYHLKEQDIKNPQIIKKSIDARYDVCYSLIVGFNTLNENKIIQKYPEFSKLKKENIEIKKTTNPLDVSIIGAGPSGLFSALVLAEAGHNVTLIEQGQAVEEREISVNNFFKNGNLNPYSNIQFGEGGAGTFSDGKLNTNVNTIYNQYVLEKFVSFGASSEILIDTKPHIGTDVLKNCLKNLRHYLESLNVKIYFNHKFIDYKTDTLVHLEVLNVLDNTVLSMTCDKLILAIGHSAKDTYHLLNKSLLLEPKPFSMGVRIEHLQEEINNSLHKDAKDFLPAASYKLVEHLPSGRTLYSFCMCPGGEVVNASSESGRLVVNGMSYSARSGKYANSAMLVNIEVDDYYKDSPLDGLYFQEKYEKLAYDLLNGKVPVQHYKDFCNNVKSTKLINGTSLNCQYDFGNINECLPNYVATTLIEGISKLERKIKNFSNNPLLIGLESRSSSPIRIKRDEDYHSSNPLIYPIGEGAGYSGGIITSAIDGIKCALKINE